MKRERQLMRNTLILGIGTFLPRLSAFITLPIYTSYLLAADVGVYDLVVTLLIGLVVPLITLQIEQAVFRFLLDSKHKEDRAEIITTSYIFVFITTIIGCLITYYAFEIFMTDYASLSWYIVVYLFTESLILVTRQVVRGLGYNKVFSVSSVIATFSNLLLIVLFLIKWHMGLTGLMVSLIIADLLSITYLIFRVDVLSYLHFYSYSKNRLIQLFKYSFPLIPNNISWWIVNAADRIIVTAILGAEINGLYAISNKIPTILTLFTTTFNLAWQETAVRSSSDKDVRRFYSKTFRNIFNIASAGMLLLIATTPILFEILVKGDFQEAIYQVPILVLGTYFSCFGTFYGGIYIAEKNSKKVGVSSFVAAIINTVVHLLLINFIGLYAASISTAIAYFVIAIYRAIDIQKKYHIRYNFRIMAVIAVFTIIAFGLFYIGGITAMIVNIILMLGISYLLNYTLVHGILNKLFKRS